MKQSCSGCPATPEALAGVRAVYPKRDAEREEVQPIEMQIAECITVPGGAEELGFSPAPMTKVSVPMASASRGMHMNMASDRPAHDT